MKSNPKYLSPCGLYCGVCGVLYATQDKNYKFLERLVGVYKGKSSDETNDKLNIESIQCDGCLSDNPSIFCSDWCQIKKCCKDNNYTGCHECNDFPCKLIDNFPMPVGKKVILRTIPYRKKYGTEKWITDEEARYHCPSCGNKLFRGVKRCNKCKAEVDLD